MAAPSTINELQDLANDLAAEMRKMTDTLDPVNKRAFTAEEDDKFKKLHTEYEEIRKTISYKKISDKAHEDTTLPSGNTRGAGRGDTTGAQGKAENNDGGSERDTRQADYQNARLAERDFQMAMRAWVLHKTEPGKMNEDHLRACRRFGIDFRNRDFIIPLSTDQYEFEQRQALFQKHNPGYAMREARAMSTAVGSSLGYTVAPHFTAAIEAALLYYGPMMQVASALRTSTGGLYPVPTDNETGATGSYTDQNTSNTDEDDIDVGVINFSSYKAKSKVVRVPFEGFRDSAIDLNSFLSSKLGERLGRFVNTECTTGTAKAKGIVTQASAGVTTASQTAITFDEIINLVHSVDIAYRNMPGAAFMFHDNVLLAIKKLKDGEGRYLWSNGTTASEPDMLCGKRYYINNDMASSIATTNVTMLFGDLSKYFIRTVGAIRLTTTDQLYWANDQIGFQAYLEFDGNLVDAGTHPVKKMTQA